MTIDFAQFPNSKKDPFLVTSQQTTHYNCIAWAFGDNTKWFWPDQSNIYYWPTTIPREEKIDSFILLFELIGYYVCNEGFLEAEFEKIAIFTDNSGKPTHASRQLNNGLWTSKLGPNFDVTHTLFALENGAYGNASVFMRRKKLPI